MKMSQQPELNEDEEYILDAVKGRSGAKKKLAVLNKTKLSKSEMDELFTGEDIEEEI